MRLDHLRTQRSEETRLGLVSNNHDIVPEAVLNQIQPTSALDILRETVRILRYNCSGFMAITALLICPVSSALLCNILVDQSLINQLSIRLLLVSKSSGLPMIPLVKQSCQRFAELVVSSAVCFPLYVTLLLLAKTAVVHTVDYSYSRKTFDWSIFRMIIAKLWKRIALTYIWECTLAVACVTLFCVLLVAFCSSFASVGFSPNFTLCAAMVIGVVFSVVYANVIMICNIALMICVLEDVSGLQALLRSSMLMRGRTQVGLVIFLISTVGMAFVEGLFDHRVKTLSYGDGSSRIWEGPLLVVLYSFVVLVDSMMTAVFYSSCRSICTVASDGQGNSTLEMMALSPQTMCIQ